ncbi:MAG: metallophosphoesterase family protein [Aeoliella sp.]
MTERVIAIGDVHGCSDALRAIVEAIAPTKTDVIVFLGDCIDRGPDTRGVIEQVVELSDLCKVIPILGNHEEMLLAAVDRPGTAPMWLECGGREALESYEVTEATDLPREHLLYLRTWVDYWETPTHFFAHANYDPRIPLENQEWGHQRWQPLRVHLPDRHVSGKTAIVGHTSQKSGNVLNTGHLICLDTYCCGGGWLTAYDTASKHYWQADSCGNLRN